MRQPRPLLALSVLVLVLVLLAMARPIDHDESQYVAAAVLSGQGLIPYRDYAYLQTPLQPLLFAPLARASGEWAYPGLRIVNALLGAVAVAASVVAMRRLGVREGVALACAGMFAATDILLFSAGTARNDALPMAMLAAALALVVVPGGRGRALLAGLLLSGAVAAKISYGLPAVAYGLYALCDRRHRPLWVAIGTLPMVALVGWTFAASPAGFVYGVFLFPATAPQEYYAATGRLWKLTQGVKALDTLKFLALGPALLALATVVANRTERRPTMLDWLILVGLIAAVLPSPVWRQYFLPMLPPLFVRLAQLWEANPPGRAVRILAVVFVSAGIAPSVEALAKATDGVPMAVAVREAAAIRAAVPPGSVATLSPQFVDRPDRRFATGPFHFRSIGVIDEHAEPSLVLVSRRTIAWHLSHDRPDAVLVGGEAKWTSGDAALDRELEAWAIADGWRRIPVASTRFRLYAARETSRRPSISPR